MTKVRTVAHNVLVLLIALCATMGLACQNTARIRPSVPNGPSPISGWPRTITDDTGATLTLTAPPKRIVSLAPSNTEILFAIGAGDRIVADTESCDFPPEAKKLPHIGGMSAGDLERIQVALPDLVVAVGSINQKLIGALHAAHVPTLAVQPRTTEDVLSTIRLLGRATGQDDQAIQIATAVKTRIERVRAITSRVASRPKTLIVYSSKPIYTSPPDSFIHDLIGVAGGTDVVQRALPQNIISPAVVIERAPEVIICSSSLSGQLRALPGWENLPAVRSNRFFSTQGTAELTRPGPRLAEAVEQLAQYLHPELFSTGAKSGPH